MTNPFDYVNSINSSKKTNLMRDSENDTLAEKGYNAWVVNKAMSYFPDTILHANLMNMYHHLDNRPQYEFLLNSVRPKKRFAKWVKNENDSDLECVMQYFGYNREKANEAMRILSKENIDYIRAALDQGGY
jgi:hypothetical protein